MKRKRRQSAFIACSVLAVVVTHCGGLRDRRLFPSNTVTDLALEKVSKVESPLVFTESSDDLTRSQLLRSDPRRIGGEPVKGSMATVIPEVAPTQNLLPTKASEAEALPPFTVDGALSDVAGRAKSSGLVPSSNSDVDSTMQGSLPTSIEPTPKADLSKSTSGSVDTDMVAPTDDLATPSVGVPVQSEPPATWKASFGSSSNSESVVIAPSIEMRASDDDSNTGQVHVSSSIDDIVDEYDAIEGNSDPFRNDNQEEVTKETRYSREDDNLDCCSTDSIDRKNNLGPLLKPGGLSDVNTSSATYDGLNTGSVVAIIGVLASIIGLALLFVAISRKKHQSDDDSPLPHGYNRALRSSARLSPTFMHDDSFLEKGYNGTVLVGTGPSKSTSVSGETADELGTLPTIAATNPKCDGMANKQNGSSDTGNVRVSAFFSSGSSLTSGSRISSSWSSVLASETDDQPSRDTRDTTLSGWSASNFSNFGSSGSGASGKSRFTRSSGWSIDFTLTDNSDRSRSLTRLSKAATVKTVDSNSSDGSTEV